MLDWQNNLIGTYLPLTPGPWPPPTLSVPRLTLSLCGYPPFHENFGNLTITEQIIRGEFTMVPSKWRHISDEGTQPASAPCSSNCCTAHCVSPLQSQRPRQEAAGGQPSEKADHRRGSAAPLASGTGTAALLSHCRVALSCQVMSCCCVQDQETIRTAQGLMYPDQGAAATVSTYHLLSCARTQTAILNGFILWGGALFLCIRHFLVKRVHFAVCEGLSKLQWPGRAKPKL